MNGTGASSTAELISETCVCASARALSRTITRLYDDELRAFGLRSTQLTLLVAVVRLAGGSPADAGRIVGTERSTLSRELKLMSDSGWLRVEAKPGRGQRVYATRAGTALLERALPAWRRAQQQIATQLGAGGPELLAGLAGRLSGR